MWGTAQTAAEALESIRLQEAFTGRQEPRAVVHWCLAVIYGALRDSIADPSFPQYPGFQASAFVVFKCISTHSSASVIHILVGVAIPRGHPEGLSCKAKVLNPLALHLSFCRGLSSELAAGAQAVDLARRGSSLLQFFLGQNLAGEGGLG